MVDMKARNHEEPKLAKTKRRIARIVQKLLQKPIVIERDTRQRLPGALIIAPPRSGTTLLRLIFDSHPEIAAPPEMHIFAPLLGPLRDERVTRAMWNAGFHPESFARSLGDFARSFVEGYAKTKQKRFWIEKTPTNVDWLPELREACPDVKFLLLFRHPFDVVRSMMERKMMETIPRLTRWRLDYPTSFAACCAFVASQHEAMLAFQARHGDIVHVIRYERLVADAEDVMRRACAFLGLDFAPQMLDFAGLQHDVGFGDEKIHETKAIIPRVDTFTGWSDEQRLEASTHLENCLDALGYDSGRPSRAAAATAPAATTKS